MSKRERIVRSETTRSPRHVICKVNSEVNDLIYIVYIKFTNTMPLKFGDPKRGLVKEDCAGVFSTRQYAQDVADCLNKIFSLNRYYDNRYQLVRPYSVIVGSAHRIYYLVVATYIIRGYIRPNEYTREIVVNVAENKTTLNRMKENYRNFGPMNFRNFSFPSIDEYPADVRSKIRLDPPLPQVNVKRYRLNDVMPTMNLDDYDLTNHKRQLKTITTELAKHLHSKKIKDALEDIRAIQNAPPSRVLPNGSLEYRELISDPAFIKRWKK